MFNSLRVHNERLDLRRIGRRSENNKSHNKIPLNQIKEQIISGQISHRELYQLLKFRIDRCQNKDEKLNVLLDFFKKWEIAPGLNMVLGDLDNPNPEKIISFGKLDHRDDIDTSVNHFYDMASHSKIITICTYWWLKESFSDLVPDLSCTIAEIFPSFQDSKFGNVTLYQLITHQSGLKFHSKFWYDRHKKWSKEEFLNLYLNPENYDQSRNIGESVIYFDGNIILFAEAVRRLASQTGYLNKTYSDLVDQFLQYFNVSDIHTVNHKLDPLQTAYIPLDTPIISNTRVEGDREEKLQRKVVLSLAPNDFKARVMNEVGPSGCYGTALGIYNFVHRLLNSEIIDIDDSKLDFGNVSNPDSGRLQNSLGFVRSNLIKGDNMYVLGSTGQASIVNLKTRKILSLTTNKCLDQMHIFDENGVLDLEKQKKINATEDFFMYWLAASQTLLD